MTFLQRLLTYKRICIQCHNNPDPDAVAAAFGVYCYLWEHGVDAFIVYGGETPIRKHSMKLLLSHCEIPVTYTHNPGACDLLLTVDCQYGQGNVERFEAPEIAIIDHHIRTVEERENYLIRNDRQSCSTVVWELLEAEGFSLKAHPEVVVALLYGLYTDTACFADLYHPVDMKMREALFEDQPLFDRLTKSNMTVAELMVASDAMQNHYFDMERRFAIVEALRCEQAVLGIIGDFMIQVDAVYLSFAYTESGAGYRISLRTCHEALRADQIAACVCEGIGGGGGHARKAGGYIQKEQLHRLYGQRRIFDVVEERLRQYIDENVRF